MSLPKRIYDLYRDLVACALVQTGETTTENLSAFQELLNRSWPVNAEELAQRDLVRGMYYSNPVGFLTYVGVKRNRVGALILWTESKRIAMALGLTGRVHISWSEDTHTYTVTLHIPRDQREPREQNESTTVENVKPVRQERTSKFTKQDKPQHRQRYTTEDRAAHKERKLRNNRINSTPNLARLPREAPPAANTRTYRVQTPRAPLLRPRTLFSTQDDKQVQTAPVNKQDQPVNQGWSDISDDVVN
jgi:hypothetical protein